MSDAGAFFDLLRARRSIRRFQPDPVDRERLLKLVEMASWAPSAGNRQDWFFTIVTGEKARREMSACVRQRWREIIEENSGLGAIDEVRRYTCRFADLAEAPVVVAVSTRCAGALQVQILGAATAAGGGVISAALAVQNLMLAAQTLGLGSCCLTAPLVARDEIHRLLGLDARQEIVCLVILGFPAESPPAPPRKPLEKIVRFLE